MLRQAHIYLPNEDRPAILVPVYHTRHLIVEQAEPELLVKWREPVSLGLGVRAVLQRFAINEVKLTRGGSVRDNPTVRISKCRTLREFESTYLRIIICAQNDAELFFDAYTVPRYEQEIKLSTVLNPCGLDVEIGRKLLRLFDESERWSEHVA